ncbi:hypothetical protein GW17_00009809 [Ensete ventricosum]|nr:hypothetical protein GW17_00009809 [Ensete ventricosum]
MEAFRSMSWEQESYPAYEDFLALPFFVLFFPTIRFFLDRFVFEVRDFGGLCLSLVCVERPSAGKKVWVLITSGCNLCRRSDLAVTSLIIELASGGIARFLVVDLLAPPKTTLSLALLWCEKEEFQSVFV